MSPQTPHRLYGEVWDPWVEGRETSCAELCTPLGNCPCPRAQFFGQERHQENWACLQGERSFTLSVLLWGTKAYGPSLSPPHSPSQLLTGILWLWLGGVGSGERGKLYFYNGIKKKTAAKSRAPGPSAQSPVCLWLGWGGVQQQTSHTEKPCILHLQKQLFTPAENSPTLHPCPSHFAWQISKGKPIFPQKPLWLCAAVEKRPLPTCFSCPLPS